jgi:outer membrane immunogenic protein
MRLKFIGLALGCGCLLIGAAGSQAADMPRPYQAPIQTYVPQFTWTGFYLGGNLGYAAASSHWTGGAGDFTVSPNGFIAGLTAGYNYQTGVWVWGLEGDLDYANLKGTGTAAVCATCTIKDTWLGTLRGRVGYAMGGWLPYFTGGGAWGNLYASSGNGSATNTKAGWALGTGLEYSWGGAWSSKLEYLYVDLGAATCAAATCGLPSDAQVSVKANLIRAGLNYRF